MNRVFFRVARVLAHALEKNKKLNATFGRDATAGFAGAGATPRSCSTERLDVSPPAAFAARCSRNRPSRSTFG